MMEKNLDSLIEHIQELINLDVTNSAYVSKPLLKYVLQWIELDRNAKTREIANLKAALLDGLDVDFTGTQWEAEWCANGKVCKCKACEVARKCVADIEEMEKVKFQIKNIDTDTREFVVNYIAQNWGSSLIVTRGKVHNSEELPGFVALIDGEVKGIITYNIENNECEIVSLDSLYENIGIGSQLINQVVNVAKKNGCRRVWLITTNDNTYAIRFYQKRGFDMAAIHRNAINESRKIKPQIPLTGFDKIPILHEIEFEMML